MTKKIDDFKKKLEAFEKGNKTNLKYDKHNNSYGLGLKISLDLVAAIVVGVLIGIGIDKIFDTKPIFFLIFFFFGIAAGFTNMYRSLFNIEKKKIKDK